MRLIKDVTHLLLMRLMKANTHIYFNEIDKS